jgi:plasmid stability protein
MSMAQFVVRQLENDVKNRLKRRAQRHGRSLEDEVRHILRNAVTGDQPERGRLGSTIAKRFRTVGLSADLPELGGQPVRSANFGK